MQPEIRSFALLLRSPVNHAIWQCEECVSKSATFLATESVNSAPFKRGETEVQIFWQGKAQNSSPILRCTFVARRSAKLIANFSATMVTSLPSQSLSLSLSLSLYLSLSHRMYLTACTTRVRKTKVRTTPVRSQQCECQQCERVNSANKTGVRMSNVRMPAVRCDIGAKKVRQRCE